MQARKQSGRQFGDVVEGKNKSALIRTAFDQHSQRSLSVWRKIIGFIDKAEPEFFRAERRHCEPCDNFTDIFDTRFLGSINYKLIETLPAFKKDPGRRGF